MIMRVFSQSATANPMVDKKSIKYAGLYAICFILCSQVFGSLLLYLYVASGLFIYSYDALVLLSSFVQYLVSIPFCCLLMRKLPKNIIPKRKLKISTLIGILGFCALLAEVGYKLGDISASFITYVLNIPVSDTISNQIGSTGIIVNFIIMVIAAPVFEELMFRKILIDRTLSSSPEAAVFVSALIFGLIHCNIYQFFYAAFIGFLLGTVYVQSGKIIYTIVLHSAFNLLLGFLPSALISVNTSSLLILIALLAINCTLYISAFVFIRKQLKNNKIYIVNFFKRINENLALIMLNSGILAAFIITTVIYLIGLY